MKFWRLLVCGCCLASGLFVVWLRYLPKSDALQDSGTRSLWGIGYALVPLLMMALGHVPDSTGRMVLKGVLVGMIVLDTLVLLMSVAVTVAARQLEFIVPTALSLAGAMGAHAAACYGVLQVIKRRERMQEDEGL